MLVFDDLERSKLSITEVLGCINDYCENNGFSTIIIANEEKIAKEHPGDAQASKALSYAEIKEKIVCRTVRYEADYSAIIHSILGKKEWPDDKYKQFLLDSEEVINNAFGIERRIMENGEEIISVQKPKNIRSLKSALQDFYRVYCKLKANGLEEVEQYLYSFIAYSVSVKASMLKDNNMYDDAEFNMEVSNNYLYFDNHYLFKAAKKWVVEGNWDEELIDQEIAQRKEQERAEEPKDVLRLNKIFEVDDEVMLEGASGLLEDCYNGLLSLNDYVTFLENSYWIRRYDIKFPANIAWGRVKEGVQKRIESSMAGETKDNTNNINRISEGFRKNYTAEELEIYDLIESFIKSDAAIFCESKKLYLKSLKEYGSKAFVLCKNNRFDIFDAEMAEATVEAYKTCTQKEKISFCNSFVNFWKNCDLQDDIKLQETIAGFDSLINLLQGLNAQYHSENLSIAAIPTDRFIEVLKKMKAIMQKTLEEV